MSERTGASTSFDALGVRVRYLGEDRGYAGVASRAIAAGDVLVRVPRSKMLTAADARACPTVGAAARALSDHRALVLKLLHEKNAFGDESRASAFAPWLATLPDFATLEETHPLLWGRERREACLPRGSPTLFRVESAKARCAADRDAIVAALAANRLSKPTDDSRETAADPRLDVRLDVTIEDVTIEDVLWATAIVFSRAFYLENVDVLLKKDLENRGAAGREEIYSNTSSSADSVAEPLAEFETVFAFGSDDFDDDDGDDWLTDDANALFDESSDEDVFEAFGGEKRLEGSFDFFEDLDDASDEPGELVDADAAEQNENVVFENAAASAPYGALALVPWADALNHSPNATSVSLLRFDKATNVATLRASRAYRAGEEVFDTYGVAKTPAETFLAYGFAAFPNEHRNEEEEEEKACEESCDACVIPGSWFWEASGRQTEAETRADASNALSLLAREEAAAGASHRSAVLGYLAAAGAAPEDVDIALRASSASKPVGDAALRWCAAATATRAELFQAESLETSRPKAPRDAFRREPRSVPRRGRARRARAWVERVCANARARHARAFGGTAPGKLPVLRQRAVARVRGGARAARRRGASARDRTGSGRDADLRLGRRDRRSARWARRDRGRRGGARAGVGGEGDARSARSARGVDVSQRQRRVRRFGVSSRAPFLFTEKKAFSSVVGRGRESQLLRPARRDRRFAKRTRRIGWH